MALHDFVSESEAANFAGVSSNTLGRFAEAGYLKVETDNDGLRFYSITELEDLFGLKAAPRSAQSQAIVTDTAPNNESAGDSYYSSHEESTAPVEDSGERMYHAEVLMAEDTEAKSSDTEIADNFSPASKPLNAGDEIELTKLRSIVKLQEKILDMKDSELKSLRKECDWLRTRIERYEEKNDRDQLLLLAETQMIRRFVVLQTQKKPSPLRLALEWVGLATPQSENIPPLHPASPQQVFEQKL